MYLKHQGEEIDKEAVFFTIRAGLGVASALGEALFCDAANTRFGPRVSYLTFLFLATNAGMFHASVALLPSSACMLMVLYGFAAWLSERHLLGLFCGAFAVIVCWPFSALMFVPMGLHALYVRGFLRVFGVAVVSLLIFAGVPIVVDTNLYGKPTFAILNLVLYNALGQGGDGQGANLYGTEPWSFYLRNLILNMNVVALLAFIAPLAIIVLWPYQSIPKPCPTDYRMALMYLLPGMATLSLFTVMAHKEERFLSMIYPILCLGAALTYHLVLEFLTMVVPKKIICGRRILRLCWVWLVLISCVVSVSRSVGLYVNFYAPLRVYSALHGQKLSLQRTTNVCVGKEWYRFPSTFFLPPRTRVAWVRNSFQGIMPQDFTPWPQGSKEIHAHFNDKNMDEASAYIDVKDCDFAVDLAVGDDFGTLGDWSQGDISRWEKIFCTTFMDTSRSPAYIRSFYIPRFSERRNVYAEFCLLKAKTLH